MNYFHALVFGIVQGICEFLPISSSTHLMLIKKILNLERLPIIFDTFLHLITLIAICIVLRKNIIFMIRNLTKKYIYKTQLNLKEELSTTEFSVVILVSIITAILSFILVKFTTLIETNIRRASIGLTYTAVLLLITQFFKTRKELPKISLKQNLTIGILQSLAVLPGISRSGSTIFACLLCGYEIKKSIRLTFLLSIPMTLLSFVYSLKEVNTTEIKINITQIALVTLAGITTLVLGIPTLHLFIKKMTNKKRLYPFALYLLILATILITTVRK